MYRQKYYIPESFKEITCILKTVFFKVQFVCFAFSLPLFYFYLYSSLRLQFYKFTYSSLKTKPKTMFVKYQFKNPVNTFCMLSLCKSKQLYSCSISSYKLGLSPVLSNRLFSTYRTFCRSTCKILKTLIIYLWRKKSEELRRKSKPKLWRQISSKSNALWLP